MEHQVVDAFLHEYFNAKNEIEKDFIAIGFRAMIDVVNAIHFQNNNNNGSVKLDIPSPAFKPIISYKGEFKRHTFRYRVIQFVKVFININRFRINKVFRKPKLVAQESFNLDHLKKYDEAGILFPISVYGKIIKSRKQKLNDDVSFIESLSSRIIEKVKDNIAINKLDYEVEDKLSAILYNHFREFSNDYFYLKNKTKLRPFLFSTGNKTAVRLYARLCLNNNKKVEAFAHGHNLQNKDKHKLWMDLIVSNTYYEQSKSLKNEIKEYIEGLPSFEKLHKIDFKYIRKYSDVKIKENSQFDLKQLDKVLIIGNATKNHAFSSVTAFEVDTQITIEEKVFNYFKKLNKSVYYKAHPGGHLKKELFEHYSKIEGLKFENEDFEKILNNYDLIVFYYTRTSTITAALNSNKPILIFDLGIEKHCSRSKEFLENRCRIEQLA